MRRKWTRLVVASRCIAYPYHIPLHITFSVRDERGRPIGATESDEIRKPPIASSCPRTRFRLLLNRSSSEPMASLLSTSSGRASYAHFTSFILHAGPSSRRSFTSSRIAHASPVGHYEALSLPRNATRQQVKARFYEVRPCTHIPFHPLIWVIWKSWTQTGKGMG